MRKLRKRKKYSKTLESKILDFLRDVTHWGVFDEIWVARCEYYYYGKR